MSIECSNNNCSTRASKKRSTLYSCALLGPVFGVDADAFSRGLIGKPRDFAQSAHFRPVKRYVAYATQGTIERIHDSPPDFHLGRNLQLERETSQWRESPTMAVSYGGWYDLRSFPSFFLTSFGARLSRLFVLTHGSWGPVLDRARSRFPGVCVPRNRTPLASNDHGDGPGEKVSSQLLAFPLRSRGCS